MKDKPPEPNRCEVCGKRTYLRDRCVEHQDYKPPENEWPRVKSAEAIEAMFVPREGEDYFIGYYYDVTLEATATVRVLAWDRGGAKDIALTMPRKDLDWDDDVVMVETRGDPVRCTDDHEPKVFDEDAWRAAKVAEFKEKHRDKEQGRLE